MPAITTIKLRRGTAAQWTSANPVLAAGEMGIETDTQRSKFGDGTTAWTSLAYTVGNSSGIGSIAWTSVTDKPTEFPPEAHTHLLVDVTDVTATATELNTLDGITASTTELNYVDGVTSAIQSQIDGKAASAHTHVMADITDLEFPPTTVLSDTAPASPVLGTRWINTTNFIEYIYYDSYWVEV